MDWPLWTGGQLAADPVALTVVCDEHDVLALVAISAGEQHCLLRPDQVGDFLRAHRAVTLACHNAGTTHWALVEHLKGSGDDEAVQIVWDYARTNRLADVGLLDQLLDLAKDGIEAPYPSLSKLTAKHALGEAGATKPLDDIQTSSPGASWDEIPEAMKSRAVEAASDTEALFKTMIGEAREIAERVAGEDLIESYGPLSLGLQVQGAIALALAERNGLHVRKDAEAALKALKEKCTHVYAASSARLHGKAATHCCFHWDDQGRVERDRYDRPKVKKETLAKWLKDLMRDELGVHDLPLDPPMTGVGKVATSAQAWIDLVDLHPDLRAWHDLEAAAYLGRSLPDGVESIHPAYQTLPRVASKAPDLDQLIVFKESGLFAPPPGHCLFIVELGDLALRCLADVCQSRGYGSRLAQVLTCGVVPDLVAAVALYKATDRRAEVPPDLAELKKTDPARYEGFRQLGRAILRAAPRGLASRHIRNLLPPEIAVDVFGLHLERAYSVVVTEVFEEISKLVSAATSRVLMENLGCELDDVLFLAFKPRQILWRVFAGITSRPNLVRGLKDVCRDDELRELLAAGKGSPELFRRLFTRATMTGAGRVRGHLAFHRENTMDFLDLADDVRKAAAFALVEHGYQLIGIAGDMLAVAIPDRPNLDEQGEADRIREVAEDGARVLMRSALVPCQVQHRDVW